MRPDNVRVKGGGTKISRFTSEKSSKQGGNMAAQVKATRERSEH